MSRPRARAGHFLALAGAVLLLVSLWQPWYELQIGDALRASLAGQAAELPRGWEEVAGSLVAAMPPALPIAGWDSMEIADIALCAIAVCAIALAAGAVGALGPGVRVQPSAAARLISTLGAVAMLVALAHLVLRPGRGEALAALVELRHGVWMAVLGSLLMLVGGASASAPDRPPPAHGRRPAEHFPPVSRRSPTSVAPPGL